MYRLNGFWTWTAGPATAMPIIILGAGVTIAARIGGTIETSDRITGAVAVAALINGTIDTVEP